LNTLLATITFWHSNGFERLDGHFASARRKVWDFLTDNLRWGEWEHFGTLDRKHQVHQVSLFRTPWQR